LRQSSRTSAVGCRSSLREAFLRDVRSPRFALPLRRLLHITLLLRGPSVTRTRTSIVRNSSWRIATSNVHGMDGAILNLPRVQFPACAEKLFET
jgi:hypothetical protein